MFFGIGLLILQAAILYFAFVGLRHTLNKQQGELGTIFIRDLLKYAALILAVLITCLGLSGILASILGQDESTYSSKLQLARWLSFVVIGIPVILVISRWIRRDFERDPEARNHPAWQVYLFASSSAALLLWFIPLQSFLKIAAGAEYQPRALSQTLVAGAVWLVHMRLIQRHSSLIANGHRFFGWFTGAVSTAVGAISTLSYGIERWVDFDLGKYQLAESVISLAVGIPVFLFYWSSFENSTGQQEARIYRVFAGMGVASLFFTIAAIFGLSTTLIWYFGDTTRSARDFFGDLPQQVSAVLVLFVVIAYFRGITRGFIRDEISRLYQYLIGGSALIAASAGVATMIAGSMARYDSTNSILTGASITALTAPHWLELWRRCQQALHIDFVSENESPTRRTYIYFFIGVPTLAGIGSAVWLTYNLFKSLLVGGQHLWQSRVPIAVLVVTLALAIYHFLILRRERQI